MGLLKLPVEVLGIILAYVPESSLFILKATSRRLKHVVEWSKRLMFELDVTVTCSVDNTQIYLKSPISFKYISLEDIEGHQENGLGPVLEWVKGIEVYMNMDVPEGDIISHGAIDKVVTILFDVMESLKTCNLEALILGFYVFIDVVEHRKLMARINASPLDFKVLNMVVSKERDSSAGQMIHLGDKFRSLEVLMKDTRGSRRQPFAYLDIHDATSLNYVSFQWSGTQRLAESQLDGMTEFLTACESLEKVGFIGGLRPSFSLPYQNLTKLPSSVSKLVFHNCLVEPDKGGTCYVREVDINDCKIDFLSWYLFPKLTTLVVNSSKSLMPLTSVLHTLQHLSLTCSTLDIFMTSEFINSPLVDIRIIVWGATEKQIMRLSLLPKLQNVKLVVSFFGQTITMDEQYEILDRSVKRLLDLGPSKFDLHATLHYSFYWSIKKSDSALN
jgi:hypothetical protein